MRLRPLIACWLSLQMLMALQAPASAAARQPDLDTWISRDLTPYVAAQLSTHPRFRHEPVRFVVSQDGNPQSTSNGLALALRDQLQDALVDTPDIRIAWQPDRVDINRNPGNNGIDCTADDVHYYIGLEVKESRNGIFEVSVRALDLEERSWVSGFGLSWTGSLSAMQHRAWRHFESDPSFRGEREVPYEDSQADMLAAHLAHELGCTLLRQVSGEYVAALPSEVDRAPGDLLELVSNNLAQYRALQFSGDGTVANAVIEGKAHQIDDDLYQYWITVRPRVASDDLPALSASAYVYLPDEFLAAAIVPELTRDDLQSEASVLTSLGIVKLDDRRLCSASPDGRRSPQFSNTDYRSNEAHCHALQAVTRDDAVVFFLQHQLNNGLVRLSDRACQSRPQARIARAEQQLRFPLPADTFAAPSWRPADNWQLNPDDDIYYAIAVSDTKAARAIAAHLSRLPRRCTDSVRAGLEGRELEQWLMDFSSIAGHWDTQVDWRVIRVKNVY